MIHVSIVEPTTNSWKRWVKDCATATAAALIDFKNTKSVVISDLYRRPRIKKDFFFAKTGPFRGRCAYCECNITDYQRGDVEHFRPKKMVTDASDTIIKVTAADGTISDHPGYFWMAYDWKNLLPACVICNQPSDGGIGKRNRFPLLAGSYAIDQAGVGQEHPLLIHPTDSSDDPAKHLDVDEVSGQLTHSSPRGKACIEIFGLNHRDQLVAARKTAINDVKAEFAKIVLGDANVRDTSLKNLQAMKDGACDQTLTRRSVIAAIVSQTKRV